MANTAAFVSNVSAIPDADLLGVTIKYTVNRASGGGLIQLYRNSTASTNGATLILSVALVNGNFSHDDRAALLKAKNYYYFKQVNNSTENTEPLGGNSARGRTI